MVHFMEDMAHRGFPYCRRNIEVDVAMICFESHWIFSSTFKLLSHVVLINCLGKMRIMGACVNDRRIK